MPRKVVWTFVCLFSLTIMRGQESPFRNAPPEVEEALRARVSEFYGYFTVAKYRQAEGLVSEPAQEAFYNAKKQRIISFEILNVNFSSDLETARVLVTCETMIPMFSNRTANMPLSSQWKLIEGDWFLHIDLPKEGEPIRTPFGAMSKDAGGPGAGFNAGFTPPTLDSLKTMYEVSDTRVSFPAAAERPITKTVTLSNRSMGYLSLQAKNRFPRGLNVVMDPAKVSPDHEMKIKITYHPQVETIQGKHELQFVVLPIYQYFSIELLME